MGYTPALESSPFLLFEWVMLRESVSFYRGMIQGLKVVVHETMHIWLLCMEREDPEDKDLHFAQRRNFRLQSELHSSEI
jgi:hypothetical protein